MILEGQRLIDKAIADTGLDDFGNHPLVEPLNILVQSMNAAKDASELGRNHFKSSVCSALTTRLQIENYTTEHPDLLNGIIEKPIFIVGLPRTGTTTLHHLLNQDKNNHTLRLWEAASPVPPPEEATYTTDPRVTKLRTAMSVGGEQMKEMRKLHLSDPEGPDECHLLFTRAIQTMEHPSLFHLPGYSEYIYSTNLNPLYAYHKRQLQLLQYKKPGNWVLKAPFHQMGLKAILHTYPDAIIVQTHRDPITLMASGASFGHMIRKPWNNNPDPNVSGRDWFTMVDTYIRHFKQDRALLEPPRQGQFLDVQYQQLLSNPLEIVAKIYALAGRKISDNARIDMQNWMDNHPPNKHGKHEYRLKDYGITEQEVLDSFNQ
tara:strand:+ start:1211 stop:2335 length:1125 start_codon:yes stop_codon:yes gene_type:complete